MNSKTKREQGKEAQANNIKAAKAVADIVRTTLGPKSMLKMLLDPMGGIVLTNDGNAILREVGIFPEQCFALDRCKPSSSQIYD
jgi:T-complex protein 1 subunit gamma